LQGAHSTSFPSPRGDWDIFRPIAPAGVTAAQGPSG